MRKKPGYPFVFPQREPERRDPALPGGALGEQLLAEQLETLKTLGRLEAQMESQREQTQQLRVSLEGKIDDLKECMTASNEERATLCREHSERLKALEHDRTWLRGASRPVRWMLGVLFAALAAIGMAGLGLLTDWLKHIMGMAS